MSQAMCAVRPEKSRIHRSIEARAQDCGRDGEVASVIVAVMSLRFADGTRPGRPSAAGILLICFFLSGATGLVYEVVWLRMLGLIFGHTVYAITAVLAAFMAGLGLAASSSVAWPPASGIRSVPTDCSRSV